MTYPGEQSRVDCEHYTVAIRNLLIAPASMSDDVSRELAQRFYDYLGTDKVSVGALKQFDRARMGQDVVVPLAAGAQSFYDSLNGETGSASGDDETSGDTDQASPDDTETDAS